MKTIRAGSFFIFGWASVLAAQGQAPAPAPAANVLAESHATLREWKPPVYPVEALKEKIGGLVVVRIIVDESGAITTARVLQAKDPRLGDAALAAVKTWKFTPAIENQKPI